MIIQHFENIFEITNIVQNIVAVIISSMVVMIDLMMFRKNRN